MNSAYSQMPEEVQKKVREKLIREAEKQRILRAAADNFIQAYKPEAKGEELDGLRIAFMAGASEFFQIWMFAADMSTDEITEEDVKITDGMATEVLGFASDVITPIIEELQRARK